jgi:hypothetical protein
MRWRIAEGMARRGHFERKRKNYALEYQLERLTTLAHHPRTPVWVHKVLGNQ